MPCDLEKLELPKEAPDSLRKFIEFLSTGGMSIAGEGETKYGVVGIQNINLSKCYNCEKIAVWQHSNMIYPSISSDHIPNSDMPDACRVLFEEAASIVDKSPRAACALLRLIVQNLCIHLGEPGRNINADIASLVQKGLPPKIQMALDSVRVVGNDAVHPGEINWSDGGDVAYQLFDLVNIVVDKMISEPRRIDEVYAAIPEAKRRQIESRDKSKS
tara:strand:+ start:167 stop:814 length:648 start_codon:yes stop_codon:yes gene_type:complete